MNKACEQRLLHVGKLLERHVLDHWRQLMMVTDHDPPLQPIITILGVLDHKPEVNGRKQ